MKGCKSNSFKISKNKTNPTETRSIGYKVEKYERPAPRNLIGKMKQNEKRMIYDRVKYARLVNV